MADELREKVEIAVHAAMLDFKCAGMCDELRDCDCARHYADAAIAAVRAHDAGEKGNG